MGPYKSALIAALVFFCGCRNRGAGAPQQMNSLVYCGALSSTAALLYCGPTVKTATAAAPQLRRSIKAKFLSDHRNRKRRNKQNLKKYFFIAAVYCGGRSCLPKAAEAWPKASPKQSLWCRNRSVFIRPEKRAGADTRGRGTGNRKWNEKANETKEDGSDNKSLIKLWTPSIV